MKTIPLRTSVFRIGDDLTEFILKNLKKRTLKEGDVLAITSKIVSLAENRVVSKKDYPDKATLIRKEADVYIGPAAYDCHLTIKHGILIPSAGIDESNSEGDLYILFPEDPYTSAQKLWKVLRKHFGIKKLGILMTDSHTTPLRRGVTGISLAHFGFRGTKSLVHRPDIFGRQLKYTYVNHADALAASAVYLMGEADEQTPMALIRGLDLEFTSRDTRNDCQIPLKEDIYMPLLLKNI